MQNSVVWGCGTHQTLETSICTSWIVSMTVRKRTGTQHTSWVITTWALLRSILHREGRSARAEYVSPLAGDGPDCDQPGVRRRRPLSHIQHSQSTSGSRLAVFLSPTQGELRWEF